jgi:predicted PhzF superfamily epimerase YddE/YHI9
MLEALGEVPEQTLLAHAYLVVFEAEADVVDLDPDFTKLAVLAPRTVIVTAPGNTVDFVSRYFAPSKGVPEDPVTGSAYCTLIPYWSKRLGKGKLTARQISRRGGDLLCKDRGPRIQIAGRAVLYLQGRISIERRFAAIVNPCRSSSCRPASSVPNLS